MFLCADDEEKSCNCTKSACDSVVCRRELENKLLTKRTPTWSFQFIVFCLLHSAIKNESEKQFEAFEGNS